VGIPVPDPENTAGKRKGGRVMTALRQPWVLCVLALAGCGSTAHSVLPSSHAGRGAGTSRATADARTAYFDLATASAALRGAAAVEGVDGRRPSSRAVAQLTGTARLLQGLSPADPLLRSIADQLSAAIGAFMRAQARDSLRQAGRAGLSATDSVNRRLARYIAGHPRAAPVIPE